VTDQYVPYVVPQHHGWHHDARWFQLGGGAVPTLRFVPKPARGNEGGFSALHHSLADLEGAHHTTDLPTRGETFVHLDVAHKGLGTASCGPDALPRYRVPPGRHTWSWTVTQGAPNSRS
jgi:hypothetical protein